MATETLDEGAGLSGTLGNLSKTFLPHILRLYNGEATKHDYEVYSSGVVFEDPLMKAQGVPQLKSAFYSLPKLFRVSKIVEYSVKETEVSPGNGQILIDNKQHYELLGRSIDVESLIVLEVKDSKIVRHEDRWDKKELNPWLSVLRRGNMCITHVLMGFGRDPKE